MTGNNLKNLSIKIKHELASFKLNVDCQLPTEGVTVVFGPSGCGKTTLLRSLAGLERPLQAHIQFKEQQWHTDERFVKTHHRQVAIVFQHNNLLPHLNVEQNINYAIKRRKRPGQGLDELIELFDLQNLIHRQPDSLSGGERQRVAMARALASAPELLLMDEPMSALDDERKLQLLGYLKKMTQSVPVVYVTHRRQEMMRIADHVVLMNKGQVAASGEFWQMMQTQHQLMTGEHTIWSVLKGQAYQLDREHHLREIHVLGGSMWVGAENTTEGDSVRLLINASDVSISLSAPQDSSILNVLAGRIDEIKPFNASQCQVNLVVQGEKLCALVTAKSIGLLKLKTGQNVFAQIKAVALLV